MSAQATSKFFRQFPSSWKSGNEPVSSGCIPNSIKNKWAQYTSNRRRNDQSNNVKLDMPTDEMGDIPPPSYQSPVKHAETQTIDEPTLTRNEDFMTVYNQQDYISQGHDTDPVFGYGPDDRSLNQNAIYSQDSSSDAGSAREPSSQIENDPLDEVVYLYTVQRGLSESELSPGGTMRKREYTQREINDLNSALSLLEVFHRDKSYGKLIGAWSYNEEKATEEDRQQFDNQLDSLYTLRQDKEFWLDLAREATRTPPWC
ncbi:hypothetical protein M231_04311 [Tremella mesenterica]|uniref:Uncharacterized protein n=1 Tax=Tremella mesenterica TaxID=5217 RepID=A0A4Q1BL96_TREME|nr:hypothetical protein M231_04311 [Tremella mesenterica]